MNLRDKVRNTYSSLYSLGTPDRNARRRGVDAAEEDIPLLPTSTTSLTEAEREALKEKLKIIQKKIDDAPCFGYLQLPKTPLGNVKAAFALFVVFVVFVMGFQIVIARSGVGKLNRVVEIGLSCSFGLSVSSTSQEHMREAKRQKALNAFYNRTRLAT
jgi:hypothetical protein